MSDFDSPSLREGRFWTTHHTVWSFFSLVRLTFSITKSNIFRKLQNKCAEIWHISPKRMSIFLSTPHQSCITRDRGRKTNLRQSVMCVKAYQPALIGEEMDGNVSKRIKKKITHQKETNNKKEIFTSISIRLVYIIFLSFGPFFSLNCYFANAYEVIYTFIWISDH